MTLKSSSEPSRTKEGVLAFLQSRLLGYVKPFLYLKQPIFNTFLRFDAMCASADAIGTKAGEPPAPEAGAWFEYQIEQLAANAHLGPKPKEPHLQLPPYVQTSTRVAHSPTEMVHLPPYSECELMRGPNCPEGYECRPAAVASPNWCMPTALRLEEAGHNSIFSAAYNHALARIELIAASAVP